MQERGKRCRLAINRHRVLDIFVDDTIDPIAQAIAQQRYLLPLSFSLLPELASPGGRVLDLGAHVGTFSLYAAALGYQVGAVDASPQNVALLRQSVEQNALSNVQVIWAAIDERSGPVEFVEFGPYGHIANPHFIRPTIPVPALSVEEVLDELGWDGVEFIKLDIEGSEVAAIRGMGRLLAGQGAPSILVEANRYTLDFFGFTPAHLLTLLESYDYCCYLAEAGVLRPINAADFQPDICVDYLAVKSGLPLLRKWQMGSPLSLYQRAARVEISVGERDPHLRAYIARSLAGIGDPYLANPLVCRALARLKADPDSHVRAAAAWWQEPPAGWVGATVLHQLLVLRDNTRDRLSRLVHWLTAWLRAGK
jgi:FkbM family methyltransferase